MTRREQMLRIGLGVGLGIGLGVSFLLAASVSAGAEVLVAGTRGLDAVAVGSRFPDDHVFKLPANAELRVLRSPDNTPFVMRGPFEGTLSSYVASCSGVLASMRRYCGSSAGDELPMGGTRGMRRE